MEQSLNKLDDFQEIDDSVDEDQEWILKNDPIPLDFRQQKSQLYAEKPRNMTRKPQKQAISWLYRGYSEDYTLASTTNGQRVVGITSNSFILLVEAMTQRLQFIDILMCGALQADNRLIDYGVEGQTWPLIGSVVGHSLKAESPPETSPGKIYWTYYQWDGSLNTSKVAAFQNIFDLLSPLRLDIEGELLLQLQIVLHQEQLHFVTPGIQVSTENFNETLNPVWQEWYRKVEQEPAPENKTQYIIVNPLQIEKLTGILTVKISRQIWYQDQFQGVVSFDLQIAALEKLFNKRTERDFSTVYLCNQDAQIIYSTLITPETSTALMQNGYFYINDPRLTNLTNDDWITIQQYPQSLVSFIVVGAYENSYEILKVEIAHKRQGEPLYVVWQLQEKQKEEALNASIKTQTSQINLAFALIIILMTVAALLILGVALTFTKRITKPIEGLAQFISDMVNNSEKAHLQAFLKPDSKHKVDRSIHQSQLHLVKLLSRVLNSFRAESNRKQANEINTSMHNQNILNNVGLSNGSKPIPSSQRAPWRSQLSLLRNRDRKPGSFNYGSLQSCGNENSRKNSLPTVREETSHMCDSSYDGRGTQIMQERVDIGDFLPLSELSPF